MTCKGQDGFVARMHRMTPPTRSVKSLKDELWAAGHSVCFAAASGFVLQAENGSFFSRRTNFQLMGYQAAGSWNDKSVGTFPGNLPLRLSPNVWVAVVVPATLEALVVCDDVLAPPLLCSPFSSALLRLMLHLGYHCHSGATSRLCNCGNPNTIMALRKVLANVAFLSFCLV